MISQATFVAFTDPNGESSSSLQRVICRLMKGPLVSDIGHITIPVREMKKALRFYRGLLGFVIEGKENPVWTVITTQGSRLTLFRQKDFPPLALGSKGEKTPFLFHVKDFSKAADFLESRGVRVKREGEHEGIVWDPFGNVLGLHDHLGSSESERRS